MFRVSSEDYNPAPRASFVTYPASGAAPLEVRFDATGSTDLDGTIKSYDWDFGDGTLGSGVAVNHIFSETMAYTVVLTVTDDKESVDTESHVINVSLPITYSGIIVDNLDAEFATTGDWSESLAGGEYAGSSFIATSDGATATWTPHLPEAGTHLVFAWWPYWPTQAENAPFTIFHANGSDIVRVNQRGNAWKWVLLGSYEFNAWMGGTGSGSLLMGHVTMTREADDGDSTSADAIRFIRITEYSHLPIVFSSGE
jgi:hypothetical protein